MCPLATALADRRFLLWAFAWTALALLGLGLTSAVVPNPIFGRSVPPEPFAIAVWLVSAPLMGLLAATYTARVKGSGEAVVLGPQAQHPASGAVAVVAGSALTAAAAFTAETPAAADTAASTIRSDGSLLGTVAGLGAFLAIGCPLCNKVVLVALGASGAMSIWAPIQPIIGAASLLLLAGTVAWRLRRRAAGDACTVPVRLGRSA